LQQAIEITSDAGGISKKKVVENSLAFRTAAIKPLSAESQKSKVKSQNAEAKLVIETSLVKEEQADYKGESQPQIPNTKSQTANTKLSALDKIRKQVKGNGNSGNGNGATNKPLELESL